MHGDTFILALKTKNVILIVGIATTDGNRTVYRDASGKVAGTASQSGNKTIYRDASGKPIGTKK